MSRFRPPAARLGAMALLLLAGCATTPSSPPAPAVGSSPVSPSPAPRATTPAVAPAPVSAANPATITGSEESSTMLDNLTVYVAAIDGQPVAAGRQGWNTPVKLKPGPRRLTVAFSRGRFAAQAELQFTARPDANYQVKFATDAELFGKNSYCEFWIVNLATGDKVHDATRVPLARVEAAK